jgi:6-phosphogluconate dehydrogenase
MDLAKRDGPAGTYPNGRYRGIAMRDLSKYKALRTKAAGYYSTNDHQAIEGNKDELLTALEQAFYFTMIISYAQGMHMLSKASEEYKYDLKLDEIAKIWRGGCIIRSKFLNEYLRRLR